MQDREIARARHGCHRPRPQAAPIPRRPAPKACIGARLRGSMPRVPALGGAAACMFFAPRRAVPTRPTPVRSATVRPYDPRALLPLRAVRRRRADLRVDLDPLPRPVRRPRRVRPDRGTGDLPWRHVPGGDGGGAAERAAARAASGLRGGGVRGRLHRPRVPRSLSVGDRPRLRLDLPGARRLGRAAGRQVDAREPPHPAAVRAARRHVPADGVGRAPDSPGQTGQDAVAPLFLQQPGGSGGCAGGRVLPRLAGRAPRDAARRRDAQPRRGGRHAGGDRRPPPEAGRLGTGPGRPDARPGAGREGARAAAARRRVRDGGRLVPL